MDSRAIRCFRHDLAARIDLLDRVTLLLGSLRCQHVAVGQRHGDPVVGVPSFERLDFRGIELPVLEGVCCKRLDCAVAVGEQGRAPGVVDDVPGFGRFDSRGREPGGGDVVVVVVLVPLRNEADVEEPEDVAV